MTEAAAAPAPQVFTRRASGLVRVMSPYSAFIYNILTMGIIFPWIWIQAPAAFQGSNLVLGILFALVAELPIALAYAWLATSLPRSGGDYVFQSRVFGGTFGFGVVFGLFVVWILQWVALSGWLVATLGLAPTFLGLGASLDAQWMIDFGVWAGTAAGIVTISILNAAVSLALLVSGFRNYVRFQYVMWLAILAAFALMLILFFANTPESFQSNINSFGQAITGTGNFYQNAVASAQEAGANFNPSFTLIGTLLIAPIAWTSLQWATYSVEQNGEIKNAHVFRNQLFILVGSLVLTAGLLILLAVGLQKGIGQEGVIMASSGFWLGASDATLSGVYLAPNMLAIALTTSPILIAIIGLGFILNSFQIVCNCYIGTTRIMVAQGLDGLLPEWFSRVHPKWKTPANAHLAYFLAAIPVILLFNNRFPGLEVPDWSTKWALGVTLANGLVFTLSALAAAFLPYRAKTLYEASPGAGFKVGGVPLVTILGVLGFATGMAMCLAFLLHDGLGLAYSADNQTPYLVVIGTVVFSIAVYFAMRAAKARRGINVDFAFRQIPPE